MVAIVSSGPSFISIGPTYDKKIMEAIRQLTLEEMLMALHDLAIALDQDRLRDIGLSRQMFGNEESAEEARTLVDDEARATAMLDAADQILGRIIAIWNTGEPFAGAWQLRPHVEGDRGRTLAFGLSHFGPPTAPRRSASAVSATCRSSSRIATPCASIAQPPAAISSHSMVKPKRLPAASSTRRAEATTSGPTPSPGMATTRWSNMPLRCCSGSAALSAVKLTASPRAIPSSVRSPRQTQSPPTCSLR